MKYRLIQNVDGLFIKTESDNLGDFMARMEVAGFGFVKLNKNPRQRVELQDQPIYSGIAGPMWDGDAVRYEDSETNAQMSA